MQISIWSVKLQNRKGEIVYQEQQKNILHLEGEQYILSAAFATDLQKGGQPGKLYVGLDRRAKLLRGDALSEAARYEVHGKNYKRLPVSTKDGFTGAMETPENQQDHYGEPNQQVFTLRASFLFEAAEDLGLVNNCFLTTVGDGDQGAIIISTPLKHSFEFWEGYRLTVEPTISLRAALLN